MDIHLKIAGSLLIILSLLHMTLPGYFNWKVELSRLSHMNRQMMVVHTFFIALIVLLMGLLCVTSSIELFETVIGNKIALGLGIFWSFRLLIQFFGYSSSHWKGKSFETIIHIILSILWTYLSVLFFFIYWT